MFIYLLISKVPPKILTRYSSWHSNRWVRRSVYVVLPFFNQPKPIRNCAIQCSPKMHSDIAQEQNCEKIDYRGRGSLNALSSSAINITVLNQSSQRQTYRLQSQSETTEPVRDTASQSLCHRPMNLSSPEGRSKFDLSSPF